MIYQTFYYRKTVSLGLIAILTTALAACGGGGGSGGGGGNPPPPPADVITTYNIDLDAGSVVAGSTETGSAIATITHNETQASIDVTVTLTGATADAVSLRRAFAGDTNDAAFALQAGGTADTWELNGQAFTAGNSTDLKNGAYYLLVSNAANPDGALRGQALPAGAELISTELADDAVVMAGPGTAARRSNGEAAIVGEMMTTIIGSTLTSYVNYSGAASGIELRRAPEGQNGPLIAEFAMSTNGENRWQLDNYPIDALLQANLDNRTLYASVTTAAKPNGAARGQVETEASMAPADPSAFVVTMTDPANAAKLESMPAMIFVTLNREPLAASVSSESVDMEASGGDGNFGNGNEIPLTPATVSANGNTVEIDLAGVQTSDDVYRFVLDDSIVDMSGIALDAFESTFEMQTPELEATLTNIQGTIFTPSCATSGCHSGNNPPDGLLLTSGNSFANIVDVDAVQVNLKRVEPGDPDNSYLLKKVKGVDIVANRMPLGSPNLSDAQIELIEQWILDGAEDN